MGYEGGHGQLPGGRDGADRDREQCRARGARADGPRAGLPVRDLPYGDLPCAGSTGSYVGPGPGLRVDVGPVTRLGSVMRP
ncbi:hypothetical protein [Streptomyces sp. H27-C3]|uniref:hypothetical protein n=1 Tax=Streptomyces sp. H27-C3 TaxID=3046305 RepID=UPI0024BB5553|nr:hypothetical protein [Streptomyces sp. H27-C3]MDJ0463521.1 hypothetical protein [Streptomyces sp. H27-C3]